MLEIEKPRIECLETPTDSSYGKYIVEPLERGYGTTLGNSLRRVLLSSLPGTAVTSVKIAGVQHEFSTIPGVKEDVTEIVLNVKSIIARLHSEGAKTVYIEASGEGVVTAGDIKADGEVEILNPEQPIATLGPDGALSMELVLNHGRGYVSADKNKNSQLAIGTIPVDSIYTPVLKVNYTVENTRVGNQTDFDKLTIEVWTDKTISARDALSLGAKILCDHFTLFTDLSDTIGASSTVVEHVDNTHDKVLYQIHTGHEYIREVFGDRLKNRADQSQSYIDKLLHSVLCTTCHVFEELRAHLYDFRQKFLCRLQQSLNHGRDLLCDRHNHLWYLLCNLCDELCAKINDAREDFF